MDFDKKIPINKVIACLLLVVLVIFPLNVYQDAPELLGSNRFIHLALLTALGGGISTVFYFRGRELPIMLASGITGDVASAFVWDVQLHNIGHTFLLQGRYRFLIPFIISITIGYGISWILRKLLHIGQQ